MEFSIFGRFIRNLRMQLLLIFLVNLMFFVAKNLFVNASATESNHEQTLGWKKSSPAAGEA